MGASHSGKPLAALPRASKGNDPLLHDFPASPGANWGGCLCLSPPATRDPWAKPRPRPRLLWAFTPLAPGGHVCRLQTPLSWGSSTARFSAGSAPHFRADKKAGDDAAGPEVSPGKGRRGDHSPPPSPPQPPSLGRATPDDTPTPDTCSTASQPAQTAPLSLPGMTCVLAFLHPQGLRLPMPFPLPPTPFPPPPFLCQHFALLGAGHPEMGDISSALTDLRGCQANQC